MAEATDNCCDKGFIWDGTPTGVEKKIGGLDAYVAEPATPSSKAILMIADVFGWLPKNPRLIADEFAKKGYLAVLPDFLEGDPIKATYQGEERQAWFAKHNIREKNMAAIEGVVDDLRANHGITKLASIGYCWGGPYVALLGGNGKSDAGIVCHGSFMTNEDIEGIKTPTFLCCSEVDQMMPDEVRNKFEEILKSKPFPSRVTVYPGTVHGFTVRGDRSDPHVATQAELALTAAIEWADAHL